MFKKPLFNVSFPELEKQILEFWKVENILQKSIDSRPTDKTKTFYDGPITANGEPHAGHMLTFALKDIMPRYWAMKGYRVTRSLGWDCQGIPVEYEVEKKLGFQQKKDIEDYGIAKFNQLCRESVSTHRDGIIELEEKLGRLTNSDEEYATMDADYIESVWWSLSELYSKGLLYEGFKVVPYSTRAGTTLSNAEVALGGYKKQIDPAVTIKFELTDSPNTFVLAWTTTPWTLPTNFALAVGKAIDYIEVTIPNTEEHYIVARELAENIFGTEYKVIAEYKGQDLLGKTYKPLFDFFAGKENCFVIYEGDYVTTDSGTGIVHLAPYGAEDNEIFQKVGILSVDVINDQGDFVDEIKPYAGMFYRKANKYIIEDLKQSNQLFKVEDYEHDLPMCWRTNTPLIYKPITSWYVAMSNLRDKLIFNNATVNWIPDHIKEGRFGNWLREVKDWGISRTRYWGTPLPVWKSESGKTKIIGSFSELEELSGVKMSDPHRPFVDDIVFTFEGETYQRIPDVLDVWYDSGAMPFARFHYPFENKEVFKSKFPAEYIAEGVDQTRGWFYSLLALSTALFDLPSYRNVIVNGLVLADDGQKLSKSKKNYTNPIELIDQFGADALRLNFFSTPISSGEDTTVSAKTVKIITQEYLLPLWNMYSFLVTYANVSDWRSQVGEHKPINPKNQWLYTRVDHTVHEVNWALDNYRIPQATREIKACMDDISKWYIRTARTDFANGDTEFLQSLYNNFVTLIHLLAPFAPFITEYLYQELVLSQNTEAVESIHLSVYPENKLKWNEAIKTSENNYTFNKDDYEILIKVDKLKIILEQGFKLREVSAIKVRQPLQAMGIEGIDLEPWMQDIIKTEINVKEILNHKVSENSIEHQGLVLSLDDKITPQLKEEGLIRELIRNLQITRKNSKLSKEQNIKLTIQASEEIQTLIQKYQDTISQPVGVVEWQFQTLEGAENTQTFKLEQDIITVSIEIVG
jgi:isoleucyl-tRNA synthetase